MRMGRYSIDVSNRDKVFFSDSGLTKGDLIEYYRRAAEHILPYLRERPISMERMPDGLNGESFYQKETPDYFPDWIERKKLKLRDGSRQEQVVCANAATLVYLADQGCITPHAWLSRTDDLDKPDRMVFDLDPSRDDFGQVRNAARDLRNLLEELGLEPYAMLTGSRGIHVVVPLRADEEFDPVRDLAASIADALVARHPDRLTVAQRKNKRGDRLFIDVARNAYGQTAVTPYVVRTRPGAPVTVPVDWAELGRGSLGPRDYTIGNILRRLAHKDDPWADMSRHARSLDPAREKLRAITDT